MNKYISKEDYLQYKGIDLELELQADDNNSNRVQRFIHEITDFCIEYLVSNYTCNELLGLFDNLKDFRQKYFREGVMEQIEYCLNNGWLNKESGVNLETGAVLDFSAVQIGYSAQLKFKLGAFCNIERY